MKKVLKYQTQKTNLEIRLRKAQRRSTIYQLYLSAQVCRMLSSDYVDIYVDDGVIGLKPAHSERLSYKICKHANGGGVVSASSLVQKCPAILKYKKFQFTRKSVGGGYLFSAKGD